METIKFKKLHPEAVIPAYAKIGDSGFDLCAVEDVTIQPGETKLVRTGLAVELPSYNELQIRPRSGMSLKTPLLIRNSPGTVDNGYRGELCVICYCLPKKQQVFINGMFSHMEDISCPVEIKKGDRIAQGVVQTIFQFPIEEVDELGSTERGSDGFGSTGR